MCSGPVRTKRLAHQRKARSYFIRITRTSHGFNAMTNLRAMSICIYDINYTIEWQTRRGNFP